MTQIKKGAQMAKHINDLTTNIVLKKKTKPTLAFSLVFAGPLIATIVLFILSMSGVMHPSNVTNWILAVIFIPLIIISMIIAQKRELIGAYGETILLLIPTFIWLLPGHDESKKWMIYMSFFIIFIGLLIFTFGMLMRYMKEPKNEDAMEKRKKIVEVLLRIGFIATAVTATLIVSIILINFGDFSLHLSKIKDTRGNDVIDYTNKSWISFIAVITILVALTLVILGLVQGNKSKLKDSYDNGMKIKEKEKPIKSKKVDVSKTMLIDMKKVHKWRNKKR